MSGERERNARFEIAFHVSIVQQSDGGGRKSPLAGGCNQIS
jgi:hypothetical protein